MFNIFKRDPVREKLKIPAELFSVTVAGAANACNTLNLTHFNYHEKFSREDIFAEVCGFHVKIVIGTMSRMEGYCGSLQEKSDRFDRDSQFLLENVPSVFNRMKDQKILSGLTSQGHKLADLVLMEKLLIADKTFSLAANYCLGIEHLDVSDNDVLDFSRKYNQKWLSEENRSNTLYAYIIRCVRLSHLDDIPDKTIRDSAFMRFNNTLVGSVVEMERNIEKLLQKS